MARVTACCIDGVDEVDKHRDRVSQGCQASRCGGSPVARARDVENIMTKLVELIDYPIHLSGLHSMFNVISAGRGRRTRPPHYQRMRMLLPRHGLGRSVAVPVRVNPA